MIASRWLRLGAALMVLGTGACSAEVPLLPPGVVVSVAREDLKNPLVVRVPDDYSPDRGWPVIFHFHGTGGAPTIEIPHRYTGGKGFVLVGMEYVTRDLPSATPDYLEREWEGLLAVREALAARVRLDPRRTYVGGFSQGGWFACEFMEVYGRDLAGAYVLGAGKRPRNKRQPKDFGLAKPVYLGAGQIDLNYIYAVQGIKHFGSLGGIVTFDDFLGMGHRMPMGGHGDPLAQSLVQWFSVESLRGQPDALRAEAVAWSQRVSAAAEKDKTPLLKWLRLSRARRSPFHVWLPPAVQHSLTKGIADLERSADLMAEIRTRAEYFALVERELRGATDGDLWKFAHAQARDFHDLWQSAPTTYHAQRAAVEFARLRDQTTRIELWRFPDEDSKVRALAEAAQNPLPSGPPADLIKGFGDLRAVLETQ